MGSEGFGQRPPSHQTGGEFEARSDGYVKGQSNKSQGGP
jgi:hypothetical protein